MVIVGWCMKTKCQVSIAKGCLFILLSMMVSHRVFPQKPLENFSTADGFIVGIGVAMDIGLRLIKSKSRPTKSSEINGFDAIALNNLSLKAKRSSDIFLRGVGPAGYVGGQFAYRDPRRSIYLTLETMLITDVTNQLAKKIIQRRRPFTYNDKIIHGGNCSAYDRDHTNANLSFYSGHTSHVAAMVFFTNTMLWYYKPGYRDQGWAWIVSGALPAIVGYQRVRAGKHFPTDVMVGYLIGAAVGYLVPRLHENESVSASGNLARNFLVGVGSGMALQFSLIKIFGHRNKQHDCQLKGQSKSQWNLTPMVGTYSGIRLSKDF